MRGSKFPADLHNTICCPIYIPSFMKIGSVVWKELRWQCHLIVFSMFQGHNSHKNFLPICITTYDVLSTYKVSWCFEQRSCDDKILGRTDGRSEVTPTPAFAFGDACKNKKLSIQHCNTLCIKIWSSVTEQSWHNKDPSLLKISQCCYMYLSAGWIYTCIMVTSGHELKIHEQDITLINLLINLNRNVDW